VTTDISKLQACLFELQLLMLRSLLTKHTKHIHI